MRDAGPRWLGIGGQRCGSTWLTDLLIQHPAVSLVGDRKELHVLYRGLVSGPDRKMLDDYRHRFTADAHVGECTPYYLRAVWAPQVAASVLDDDALVWCILRDPVERFSSAIRHEMQRARERGEPLDGRWERLIGSDASWGGMYADQLDAWVRALGRSRLTVLQYEVVRRDPQPVLDGLWGAMDLGPVTLTDVDRPSATTSRVDRFNLDEHPGLRDRLRELYQPQVARLIAEWDFERDAWLNFSN